MNERLRALKRIRAVQQTLRDMADWKLGAAERAKADVTAARTALETYLSDAPPTGTFAAHAVRQVGRLLAREAEAEHARAALAASKLEAETRLKLAERVADTLGADERDRTERRRLEELVETMLARASDPRT